MKVNYGTGETAKFDKGRKYDTYEKFGVLEYNLVEQNGFIVQHALIDGAYQIVTVYKNDDDYMRLLSITRHL